MGPQLVVGFVLGVRQQVDDLAEQHRFIELERGDGDVSEGQHDRQPPLVAQESDHPAIDAKKFHPDRSPTPQAGACSPRKRSTVFTKKLTPNGIAMSLKS